MTRTRWAGHAWLAFTLTMIGCIIYTATHNPWLILPAWIAASTSAGLAFGCYTRANREQQIARRLAALRGTPAATCQIRRARLEQQLRKDTP